MKLAGPFVTPLHERQQLSTQDECAGLEREGGPMPAAALCQPEVWMPWSNNGETIAKASRKCSVEIVECG